MGDPLYTLAAKTRLYSSVQYTSLYKRRMKTTHIKSSKSIRRFSYPPHSHSAPPLSPPLSPQQIVSVKTRSFPAHHAFIQMRCARLGGDSFNSRIVYAITSDLSQLCKEKVDLTLKVVF